MIEKDHGDINLCRSCVIKSADKKENYEQKMNDPSTDTEITLMLTINKTTQLI